MKGGLPRGSAGERHLEGPELLHVLEGAVEVSLFHDSGPVTTRLDAGSISVVPMGVWHAHTPLVETAASIAAVIGVPARARMLYCLLDGQSRTWRLPWSH